MYRMVVIYGILYSKYTGLCIFKLQKNEVINLRYKFGEYNKEQRPILAVSDLMSACSVCVGVCVCICKSVRACLDPATKALLHLSLFSRGAQNGRSEAAFIDNK